MADERYAEIDDWLEDQLGREDRLLAAVQQASADAGLPPIEVSPAQGRFLRLLAEIHGARRILEIGTLGGYSTVLLGRALPEDGRLVSIEIDPRRAEVARANLGRAGIADRCEVRTGDASAVLADMVDRDEESFDLVFVDADKASTAHYVRRTLELTRVGSVVVVDNVVRGGRILDPEPDEHVRGIRSFLQMAATEPRLDATALQTVGRKGHDGFVLARVVEPVERPIRSAGAVDPPHRAQRAEAA